MSHDVFISHSTKDKAVADAVVKELESYKVKCWVAPRDIISGMDWSDSIIDAIGSSRLMLLIFSGSSNESEHVKREVQNAVSEEVPILPFRIENVPMSKHMRYFIGTSHWLEASSGDVHSHLDHLRETTQIMLSRFDSSDDIITLSLDDFIENNLDEAGVRAVRLKAGETLFRQNELGQSMYVLVEGRVDIMVASGESEPCLVDTIEPVTILGEMSLFLNHARTASAVARTDVFLWEVALSVFAAAISHKQRWAVKLLLGTAQIMARRILTMNRAHLASLDKLSLADQSSSSLSLADEPPASLSPQPEPEPDRV